MTLDELGEMYNEQTYVIGFLEADNKRLDAELKEAKRLLKSAIDEWHIVCEWGDCGEHCVWYENGKCTQEWSGKAEAFALIGEEGEQND